MFATAWFLTLVFFALKVAGLTEMSWWAVAAPVLVLAGFILGAAARLTWKNWRLHRKYYGRTKFM